MVQFASAERAYPDLYKLIIGSVVPRPIAFVATRDKDGAANLAPFSFFNAITGNPPTLAFSVIDRGTRLKDTSRNIQEHPEFIVHIVGEDLATQMNITCGEYGAHIDEFREAGLTPVPGTLVQVPRVQEALVSMECKLTHHLRIGRTPPMASHIIGEVVYWHLSDAVLMERSRVNADVLLAIGRMGGSDYTRTRDRFTMERPVVADEDPRSVASALAARQAASK
ncbi:MAG TPA: flavin reductase family protein [bacterium]|nr:flavin reductase family protein [bacterium]